MTLLKQFNEKLKELPDISRKLEETIIMGEWPDEKNNRQLQLLIKLKMLDQLKV